MTDISVIGLGRMGAAIAHALLGAGHAVTVWNRSAAKGEPLVAAGAKAAASPAEAVRASPAVLVCVDNYAITREILGEPDAFAGLSGRTVIQLSTGSPREARASEAWLRAGDIGCLDGALLCGPMHIGTPDALLLVAGPRGGYGKCEPFLKSIDANHRYLGENIGAPAALDLAWLCQRLCLFLGLAHGALLCQSEKVGVDLYASMFPEGDRARAFAQVVHGGNFDNDPTAALGVWHAALERVRAQAVDAGISAEVPDFALSIYKRAMAAGHARDDVASLITALRGDG